MKDLSAWLDAREPPHTSPLLQGFGPPRYALRELHERVEPWATYYDEARRELPWHEYGEPDPLFYQPTPLLIELQDRVDALGRKAYRVVPNPDYDPERAEEWYRQRGPINQVKMEWGQSYAKDD